MAQLYTQRAVAPDSWDMSGAPATTVICLSVDATINYSDGSTSDTLPANTPAVLPDTTTSFDRTHDVYVPYTVQGSGVLSIIKESLLPTLTVDYAPLARVELHGIKPYQPEPYLVAGGLGGAATTLLPPVVSAVGLGKTFVLGTAPSGWQTPGYDDSAWSASLAGPIGDVSIAGAAWESYLAGNTSAPAGQVFLYRRTFALPSGLITAALLTLAADDYAAEVWINGTLVYGSVTSVLWNQSTDVTVRPSLLRGGQTNVMAIKVQNSAGGLSTTGTAYSLALSESATGGAPTSGPGGTVPPATLPVATTSGTGIVQVGSGLSVTGGGVLSTTTSGTVTSVNVAVPAPLAAAGGPISSSGTITLSWASGQVANRVLASPDGTTGAVSLRALVGNDIPVDASTIVSSAGTIKGNYQAGSGVSISGNTISATGSGGSVTSVALTVPGIFSVSGSPVTTSGTLAVSLQSQAPHTVWAGPASGSSAAPTFRALTGSDLPKAAGAGGRIHAHGHFL